MCASVHWHHILLHMSSSVFSLIIVHVHLGCSNVCVPQAAFSWLCPTGGMTHQARRWCRILDFRLLCWFPVLFLALAPSPSLMFPVNVRFQQAGVSLMHRSGAPCSHTWSRHPLVLLRVHLLRFRGPTVMFVCDLRIKQHMNIMRNQKEII